MRFVVSFEKHGEVFWGAVALEQWLQAHVDEDLDMHCEHHGCMRSVIGMIFSDATLGTPVVAPLLLCDDEVRKRNRGGREEYLPCPI